MMTAIHFIKFFIKLLLLIIILPFLLLWHFARYRMFRHALIDNMTASGMPKYAAKHLARETRIRKMLKKRQRLI